VALNVVTTELLVAWWEEGAWCWAGRSSVGVTCCGSRARPASLCKGSSGCVPFRHARVALGRRAGLLHRGSGLGQAPAQRRLPESAANLYVEANRGKGVSATALTSRLAKKGVPRCNAACQLAEVRGRAARGCLALGSLSESSLVPLFPGLELLRGPGWWWCSLVCGRPEA